MTGLYSEAQTDDSSADIPQDTESESLPMSVNTATTTASTTATSATATADTVIKCHSRQPSSSVMMDRDKPLPNVLLINDDYMRDCGILNCRPSAVQHFARIKVRFWVKGQKVWGGVTLNDATDCYRLLLYQMAEKGISGKDKGLMPPFLRTD